MTVVSAVSAITRHDRRIPKHFLLILILTLTLNPNLSLNPKSSRARSGKLTRMRSRVLATAFH